MNTRPDNAMNTDAFDAPHGYHKFAGYGDR